MKSPPCVSAQTSGRARETVDWRSSLANHLASRARDSIWERIYIFRVAQIKAGEILFDQHFKPAPSAKSQTSIGTTILKSRILRQSYATQINEACEKGIARCKSRHFDWVSEAWRRRRDSNPRDPFGPNGFQDRRIHPLCHSSAVILLHLWKPALHILHLFFHFPGTNETNR